MTRHPLHPARTNAHRRAGITVVEVAVILLLLVVTVAIALPPLSVIGCSSMRARSRMNLATLAQAHVAYAGDWEGRQFTMVPDDLGAFGGCEGYLTAGHCIPGASLGLTCAGKEASYPIGCADSGGSCTNFAYVRPLGFDVNDPFGAYRIPNAAGFNQYVNGRFYSPAFYAPDDAGVIEYAAPYFPLNCGYAGTPGVEPTWSSYILSAAAMFDPAVLSRATGYKHPDTLADGYKSPPLAAVTYPHLKSHMIEHNTIENSFTWEETPWRFNAVYQSRPLALMYDGSVRILSPAHAMESDRRAVIASYQAGESVMEHGLWIRNTPFPNFTVIDGERADFLVQTKYHHLTGDGILGRDILD